MRERASHANAGQSPCLSIERVDLGDEVVVVLRGEFDLSGVDMFDGALTQIARGRCVILDLRYLSFLDCSGLEAMILLDRRARAEGWFLLLARPQRQVVRLLQLTGVDGHLRIVEKSQPDTAG
jgi:anti-anti-sigma factor